MRIPLINCPSNLVNSPSLHRGEEDRLIPNCLCYVHAVPLAAWLCEDTIQSLPSSNARQDSVPSWLSHAPLTLSDGKRKRSYGNTSDMTTRDSSLSKHRRCEVAEHLLAATEDVENTPRAKPNPAFEPPSPSSFTSSSRKTHSSHSRRSSSLKKKQAVRRMASLSLLPNPVVLKSINDTTTNPPRELENAAVCIPDLNHAAARRRRDLGRVV